MGAININSQKLAQLKSFGKRGVIEDAVISAMLDGIKVLELTLGAEAADKILVSGQLKDMDGSNVAAITNIKCRSTPIAGAGTMEVTVGTAVVGDTTVALWLKTDATGAFAFEVTNASAEITLIELFMDDGMAEQAELTFA